MTHHEMMAFQQDVEAMLKDGARFRKLKKMLESGVSASIDCRQSALYYEPVDPKGVFVFQVYPETPVGFESYEASTLEELLDKVDHIWPAKDKLL
jgi:hypothetical protein